VGSTPLALQDDAVALTPSLFLGYKLSIDHTDFLSVDQAVETILSGGTVLVSDGTAALDIMLRLGITPSGALRKLHRANNVLPYTEDLTI
jgi:hypothetical protein